MKQKLKQQGAPLLLTILSLLILCGLLYGFIKLLNAFPTKEKVQFKINLFDILIGMTIYLKTSIDFAIFIGNIMSSNQGWKKRIAVEIGTALGNALGTFAVLFIWFFFKEAPILMILMIFFAAIVLLRMAEEGFEEFLEAKKETALTTIIHPIKSVLSYINRFFHPIVSKVLPEHGVTKTQSLSFMNLLIFSATVPFILGLDDFAGYIPLFNIINVFGFSIGVFFAHMILNLGLFAFPKKTVALVKNPLLIIFGSIAFVAIALWGIYDAIEIIKTTFFH